MSITVFRSADIMDGLSGSAHDPQRRNWLLGEGKTVSSFAGVFTRQCMNNIESQPWRWHDDEEVEYIIAGRMRIQTASDDDVIEQDVHLGEGDLFYIAAGVRHRADAVGDELCIGLLFCPKAYVIPPGQVSHTD